MTKDFEESKAEKPPSFFAKVLVALVTLGLFVVALLFLLMVALPKGLWLEVFAP